MANTPRIVALPRQDGRRASAAVVLTALGVVYGDIGTSPLYGLKQAVDAGGMPSSEAVMGIVSLILRYSARASDRLIFRRRNVSQSEDS